MSLGQISETWQGKTLEGDWNIILMKRKVKRAWHKVLQLKVLVLEPKNILWYCSQLPRPTLWTFKSIRLNLKPEEQPTSHMARVRARQSVRRHSYFTIFLIPLYPMFCLSLSDDISLSCQLQLIVSLVLAQGFQAMKR